MPYFLLVGTSPGGRSTDQQKDENYRSAGLLYHTRVSSNPFTQKNIRAILCATRRHRDGEPGVCTRKHEKMDRSRSTPDRRNAMFQRLDELQTGSLYILTGQAGAGKSHLASSARRAGTLWVLDTEGAAQNLAGKPGIHRRIQVMQSLSLKALVGAMDEIRSIGKPGDTVVLD